MDYMDRALELAQKAIRNVSPNPPVGALVVSEGNIVGKGWTQPPGKKHAEIMALDEAKELAKDSVLYITLEPCCFYGRTPPCVEAIVEAGVKEVHVPILDPNPKVNGNGLEYLQNYGVNVVLGEQSDHAKKLVQGYSKYILEGIPFVTVKYAMSLDGKIASKNMDSKWISGEKSRSYVQKMRSSVDALMVGINTVKKDDPRLTVRNIKGEPIDNQPLRVIIDSDGSIDAQSNVINQPGDALVVVANREVIAGLKKTGAKVEFVSSEDGNVDLISLMKTLASKYEITNIMVEGGGKLVGSLFDLGLVDSIAVFVAPIIVGGENAITPVEGKGVELIKDAFHLNDVKIVRLDQDFLIMGSVR